MNVLRASSIVLSATALYGCASSGRLNTSSGGPEVRVSRSWFKELPVAIAEYNLDHGRHLDETRRNEIVTFDGVKSNDGSVDVRSKTVYRFIETGDSVTVVSTRLMTNDLDDEDVSAAEDQPTLDEQQAELEQIVRQLTENIEAVSTAPSNAGSGHSR